MAPYYCIAVGSRGPRVEHATLEAAQAEAARLHAALGGQYAVRILETSAEIAQTAPRAPEPPEKPPEPPKPAPVQPKQKPPQAAKPTPAPPKPKAAPVVVVKKKRSAEAPASEA